jgi:hypothetical protein
VIIYQASKRQFLHHALRDDIEDVVSRHYRSATGQGVGAPQFSAWKHSLLEMAKVLGDEEISQQGHRRHLSRRHLTARPRMPGPRSASAFDWPTPAPLFSPLPMADARVQDAFAQAGPSLGAVMKPLSTGLFTAPALIA